MPVFENNRFPLLDHATSIERIRAAVTARAPYSMIRIGDGEAVVMSVDESTWLHDLAYLHNHWGAERVSLRAVREVQRDLAAAMAGADLVGVRDDIVDVPLPDDLLDRPISETATVVREHFALRDEERKILSENAARRLAQVHRVMSGFDWSPGQEFCSAWIHWELLADGTINEILDSVDDVVLVTSKPELGPVVADRFDIRTQVVTVPDKFVDVGGPGAHVPERYGHIRAELAGIPAGTLVLVGAGIPGKVYCQWAKEAGCVAIDVGSVLDAWIGKASRPLVLRDRFGVTGDGGVPDHLRLIARVETDEDATSRSAPGPVRKTRGDRGAKVVKQLEAADRKLAAANRKLAAADKKIARLRARARAAERELAELKQRRSVRAAVAVSNVLRRKP